MKFRLRYWRERRALSIRDLAELAHVSTRTIQDTEKTGDAPKRPSVRRKLAEALQVSLEALIVDEPTESNQEQPEQKAT